MWRAPVVDVPTPSDILAGLARTSNEWIGVAAAWHLVLALALLAALTRVWRPSARAAALGTAALPASVSVFAWLAHNPFNGTVFAVATLALVAIGWRAGRAPVRPAARWVTVVGALAITFGWLYPHFLDQPAWVYAIAAPLGLVPCPTLSVVLGIGLCSGMFGSRAWGITAGAAGLFYGVFGVARLGVWLDVPLVASAVTALVLSACGLGSGHVTARPELAAPLAR